MMNLAKNGCQKNNIIGMSEIEKRQMAIDLILGDCLN